LESIASTKNFIDELRIVQDFLSKKYLRRAFQAMCLSEDERSQFHTYSVVHIDWKWEFLSRALNALVPLLNILALWFDASKLKGSINGVADETKVEAVGTVLRGNSNFAERAELFRVAGCVTKKYSSKLEGCWCHEEIWTRKLGYKRRKMQLLAESGSSKCMWKGKLGPWWVAVGMAMMFTELAACSSSRLDAWLSELDRSARAALVDDLQRFRTHIIEVLKTKLSFWLHIPFKALGIFWVCCGGDERRARRSPRNAWRNMTVRWHPDSPYIGWRICCSARLHCVVLTWTVSSLVTEHRWSFFANRV